MTPEEETEALLDALGRGQVPDPADPAVRLLAALLDDVDQRRPQRSQRRSSVSMTPST
ncbi:hypothetical protein [Nonomuraea candida]|uniref:hypothetical protein n=1 Tax=Nonomuraea candida TaxID=359159 RepID=UPI000B1591AC|nr:hypothetical protein [Nonomuraea candida]